MQAWRPSLGYLALALVVAVGVPAYWLMSSTSSDDASVPAARLLPRPAATPASGQVAKLPDAAPSPLPIRAAPVRIAEAASMPAATPVVPRVRDPNGDLTPDLSDFVNAGERPTMAEVISRLQDAGVYSGLGAFSPPGTRPPLIGLAVPEDFILPEGYVRHYQATDDGQRIEPILMYSPDYQWVDAAGRPVQLPPDRVVPQEFAPPGLPIRRIVVPAPLEPGK